MRRHLLFVSLAIALPAMAQSEFAPIIASALDHNPQLASTEKKILATEHYADADNSLDAPSLDFEYLWNSNGGDNRWNLSISQEFDLPSAYGARREAARLEYAASRAMLAGLRADKALSVKEAILDLINANMLLEYYRDLGQRIAHIANAVNRSFDIGEATILDQRKMQLAVLDNEQNIADAQAKIDYCIASLQSLGAVVAENSATLWHVYPLQSTLPPTPENNPLLFEISNARKAAAIAQVRAAKFSSLPSFEVGYAHAYEDGTHFNGLTIGLKLPSFGTSKRRKATALEALAIEIEANGETTSVLAESQGVYANAQRLKEIMEKYRSLTNDNSYLHLLTKAYDSGQLTVIDYLNEVNLFSNSRLAYLDLLYRYNLALARLNRYRSADF